MTTLDDIQAMLEQDPDLSSSIPLLMLVGVVRDIQTRTLQLDRELEVLSSRWWIAQES